MFGREPCAFGCCAADGGGPKLAGIVMFAEQASIRVSLFTTPMASLDSTRATSSDVLARGGRPDR
jgi:hypothetical protein